MFIIKIIRPQQQQEVICQILKRDSIRIKKLRNLIKIIKNLISISSMPPLLTKIDFGLISLADQANEIIIYNLVNMDQVFRLRGKSSLSLKFLYSSNFEFCVFFF